MYELPDGTELFNGAYRILTTIGSGGFGITYQAMDLHLNRVVAIKEWFPRDCRREGLRLRADGRRWTTETLEQFKRKAKEEGQILARLDNPHIVKIYSSFEANNTVYFVMEFIAGMPLEDYRKAQGGRLPVEEAVATVRSVGAALQVVHAANLLHRDIKTLNIMRRANGQMVLIDFGASREFVPDEVMSHTTFRSDGYAPPEQYERHGKRGPALDIYALSATLYVLLTGEVPHQDSRMRKYEDRLKPVRSLRGDIPEALASFIINRGMAIEASGRPQTVASFLQELNAVAPAPLPPQSDPVPKPPQVITDPPPISRRVLIGGAGILCFAGWEWMQQNHALPGKNSLRQDKRMNSSSQIPGVRGGTPPNASTIIPPRVNDGAELVFVPAGPFWMGDDDDVIKDWLSGKRNNPRHTVDLSAYWIYKNLVTVEQYQRFCDSNPDHKMPDAPRFNPNWSNRNHPIVNVSWKDATAYAQWAGSELPTEAQWEKAARGTDGRKYPWGNDWNASLCANSVGSNNLHGTVAVGSYSKGNSPYGCLDMAGNVWEWCRDWYDADYWNVDRGKDPENQNTGRQEYRVLRGGSGATFIQTSSAPRTATTSTRLSGTTSSGSGVLCVRALSYTVLFISFTLFTQARSAGNFLRFCLNHVLSDMTQISRIAVVYDSGSMRYLLNGR